MGDTLSIPITKAKGQSIEVDPSELSDDVYQYILTEGLKVVLNARMAKVGAVTKLEGKDLAAAQAAAMKIANENLADLKAGKTVMVAAHGNSLRALVKHLDGISDEDIAGLNIPTGIPLVYELDADLKPVVAGGTYLDPEAAIAAAAAVANQGKK